MLTRGRGAVGRYAQRRWFAPTLALAAIVALGALGFAATQLAAQTDGRRSAQTVAMGVPRATMPPVVPRIDATLIDPASGSKVSALFTLIFRAYQEGGQSNAERVARELGLLDDRGVRAVFLLDRPYTEAFGDRLRQNGLTVESWSGNSVTVVFPMDRLVEVNQSRNFTFLVNILSLPEIVDMDAPQRVQRQEPIAWWELPRDDRQAAGQGPSQGVMSTGANRWHSANLRGQGVRVGVIDSFGRFREVLGRFLPPAERVTARDFTGRGLESETDTHGTGCAQIIFEMAPDATLFLANVDTLDQFSAAIDWLIEQRVAIINMSLGFPFGAPDGTSAAARKIDQARAAGILPVVSAGNNASRTFVGRSPGRQGLVVVGENDTNLVPVRYGAEGLPSVILSWDNPEARFALILADGDGRVHSVFDRRVGTTNVVAGALDRRLGGNTFFVGVEQRAGPPAAFRFQVTNGTIAPLFRSSAISLGDTASARGALAVAAVDWRTDQLAVYSSWGATLDGRWKPEIAAPSHVANWAFQRNQFGFTGTSAAAPHVAGAAALVKGRFPNFTADEVQRFLLTNARPIAAPAGGHGAFAVGTGRLTLPDPATLR